MGPGADHPSRENSSDRGGVSPVQDYRLGTAATGGLKKKKGGTQVYTTDDGQRVIGVSRRPNGLYMAQYWSSCNGKARSIRVGCTYKTVEEAARARDRYLIDHLGLPACEKKLSFPPEDYVELSGKQKEGTSKGLGGTVRGQGAGELPLPVHTSTATEAPGPEESCRDHQLGQTDSGSTLVRKPTGIGAAVVNEKKEVVENCAIGGVALCHGQVAPPPPCTTLGTIKNCSVGLPIQEETAGRGGGTADAVRFTQQQGLVGLATGHNHAGCSWWDDDDYVGDSCPESDSGDQGEGTDVRNDDVHGGDPKAVLDEGHREGNPAYLGVTFSDGQWIAQYWLPDGTQPIACSSFSTAEAAARAYDRALFKHRGLEQALGLTNFDCSEYVDPTTGRLLASPPHEKGRRKRKWEERRRVRAVLVSRQGGHWDVHLEVSQQKLWLGTFDSQLDAETAHDLTWLDVVKTSVAQKRLLHPLKRYLSGEPDTQDSQIRAAVTRRLQELSGMLSLCADTEVSLGGRALKPLEDASKAVERSYQGLVSCPDGRWEAVLEVDGKLISRGKYWSRDSAAEAYDRGMIHYKGMEFSKGRTNLPWTKYEEEQTHELECTGNVDKRREQPAVAGPQEDGSHGSRNVQTPSLLQLDSPIRSTCQGASPRTGKRDTPRKDRSKQAAKRMRKDAGTCATALPVSCPEAIQIQFPDSLTVAHLVLDEHNNKNSSPLAVLHPSSGAPSAEPCREVCPARNSDQQSNKRDGDMTTSRGGCSDCTASDVRVSALSYPRASALQVLGITLDQDLTDLYLKEQTAWDEVLMLSEGWRDQVCISSSDRSCVKEMRCSVYHLYQQVAEYLGLVEEANRKLPAEVIPRYMEACAVSPEDPRGMAPEQKGARATRNLPPGTILGVYRGHVTHRGRNQKSHPLELLPPPPDQVHVNEWALLVESHTLQLPCTFPSRPPGLMSICCLENGDVTSLINDPVIHPLDHYTEESVEDVSDAHGSSSCIASANVRVLMIEVRGWPFPFLVTTQEVIQGQELLMSYGGEYWQRLRRRMESMEDMS